MGKFSSGQLLNNLLNPFSEKERESTTNCSLWTQWARQQSTTEMLQKSLDRLNFSTDPRFSFFTRPMFTSSFCGSNRPHFTFCFSLFKLFNNVTSLLQCSNNIPISDEEHLAPTPPLANHCSRILWTCPLNVFHWFSILHFHSS